MVFISMLGVETVGKSFTIVYEVFKVAVGFSGLFGGLKRVFLDGYFFRCAVTCRYEVYNITYFVEVSSISATDFPRLPG